MNTRPKVALVSMPWAPILEPSLGLGIASACLSDERIENRVFHFNLRMLEFVKYTTYQSIGEIFGVNESLFMDGLNGPLDEEQLNLLSMASRDFHGVWKDARTPNEIFETLVAIRTVASRDFLDLCMKEIEDYSPEIIGFTCMFDQIGASLALAAKVREALPETTIVLGGYSVSGRAADQLEQLDCVDYVYVAEAEERFAQFCRAVISSQSVLAAQLSRPTSMANLEKSPTPNFDFFFEETSQLLSASNIEVRTGHLPIDSSRGCWWGQKNHCTFCGIRKEELVYRSKSAERLAEQVSSLNSKYGSTKYRISDYILPLSYLEGHSSEVLQKTGFSFAAEMKSNINQESADNLKKAGFEEIQIGVESFSDATLKMISKGVSGLQNLNAIRLLNERGINAIYNIIYGFEFEDPVQYLELAENAWKLHHLSPPTSFVRLAYTADSPLTISGLSDGRLKPHKNYDLAYPQKNEWCAGLNREDLAYYFEGDLAEDCPEVLALGKAIAEWRRASARGASLNYWPSGGSHYVEDNRRASVRYELSESQVRALKQLGARVRRIESESEADDLHRGTVDELWALGLVYVQHSRAVSLLSVD